MKKIHVAIAFAVLLLGAVGVLFATRTKGPSPSLERLIGTYELQSCMVDDVEMESVGTLEIGETQVVIQVTITEGEGMTQKETMPFKETAPNVLECDSNGTTETWTCRLIGEDLTITAQSPDQQLTLTFEWTRKKQ